MSRTFEKQAGIALIVFTILIFFTMVFHPAGGNFRHLLMVIPTVLITHSMAILSLPFAALGFWGLTKRIGLENLFAVSAFAMSLVALIAALLAGSTNGLVLPLFVLQYKDAAPDTVDMLRPFLAYSHAVNAAFDYVYTGAFCLAILFWSIAILKTRRLPRWMAVLGTLVAIAGVTFILSGISPASLYGFHLFVATLITWTIAVGIALVRTSPA
jgi:hypothetical protein